MEDKPYDVTALPVDIALDDAEREVIWEADPNGLCRSTFSIGHLVEPWLDPDSPLLAELKQVPLTLYLPDELLAPEYRDDVTAIPITSIMFSDLDRDITNALGLGATLSVSADYDRPS